MIANKNAKEKLSLGLWVTKIKTDTAVSGVLTTVIYPTGCPKKNWAFVHFSFGRGVFRGKK